MDKLLLEIGTEEIPAGYIKPALNAMAVDLTHRLKVARISCGDANVYGTPRRLAVIVKDVAPKQQALSEEVVGPPEKVAFDKNGQATKAAEKFAEKIGVSLKKLKVKEMKKGRYLYARRTERGLAARSLLRTILPKVIASVPFPKQMKWGSMHETFARPIHSLAALYGKKIVSFEFAGVKSGRFVRGHYFMNPQKIKLGHPDDYLLQLKAAQVMADIDTRKSEVKKTIDAVADSIGGKILDDEELLDIVTNLVEYPAPVIGRFDKDFLALPPEILITAMREHQKYFALVDDKNELLPAFVAVNNTVAKDMDLVADGHGRVIRARLADARFFYNSDIATPMEEWVDKLKGVTFQAKLGTMREKTTRIQKLAQVISDEVVKDDSKLASPERLGQTAGRAAFLSKADLVSEVVGEFPKLQGVMGRIYAQVAGEHDEVSHAIEEHYRPTHSGGKLPDSLIGAVVSIADKLDSICGFFSVGLVPTGASDPYALRRQGIGLIQIMTDKGFTFSLDKMVGHSLSLYDITNNDDIRPIKLQIIEFLKNRINRMVADDGYPKDLVQAVTQVSVDHIPRVWDRIRALETLKLKADFDALVGTFKRVGNIIRKAEEKQQAKVSEHLFENKSETDLFKECRQTADSVKTHLNRDDITGALLEVASLKTPVDKFFDDVMVMVDDEALRKNRLALLREVAALFDQFADFSRIAT